MMDETREALAAHGVEKLAVPLIKSHLPVHDGNGKGSRANEDRYYAPPTFGLSHHARKQRQVTGKIEFFFICKWG